MTISMKNTINLQMEGKSTNESLFYKNTYENTSTKKQVVVRQNLTVCHQKLQVKLRHFPEFPKNQKKTKYNNSCT